MRIGRCLFFFVAIKYQEELKSRYYFGNVCLSKKVYYVPPEIAGLVTLKKAILTVQYIQLKQIHKVPEKSERCITIL